jgi:hypothetical protein
MKDFVHIAPYLNNPLVLIGFLLLLFFGLHRTLIKSKIIQPLSSTAGSKVLRILLRYGFIIALTIIVAGFMTEIWKTYLSRKQTSENVDKLLGGIENIAKGFEILQKEGGIITGPSTPQEYYHNARIHEINGDFLSARKDYEGYMSFGLDFIDPHLRYQAILKSQEGIQATREIYNRMNSPQRNLTLNFATTLLTDRPERIGKLQALVKANPDFGPAYYQLSKEYSKEAQGEQTLSDMKSERHYLEKFSDLNARGKFTRYFLDQEVAAQWQNEAANRLHALTRISANVLKSPVTLSGMLSNDRWMIHFEIADLVKEIFYKFDGPDPFKSTGISSNRDSKTGLMTPEDSVTIPNLNGRYTILVKYTDLKGSENGPFKLTFDTNEQIVEQVKQVMHSTGEWVSFSYDNGRMEANFGRLLSHRNGIKEIRYSLNNETLSERFPLTVWTEKESSSVQVPLSTKFLCVKLSYIDGTQSETKKIMNTIEP